MALPDNTQTPPPEENKPLYHTHHVTERDILKADPTRGLETLGEPGTLDDELYFVSPEELTPLSTQHSAQMRRDEPRSFASGEHSMIGDTAYMAYLKSHENDAEFITLREMMKAANTVGIDHRRNCALFSPNAHPYSPGEVSALFGDHYGIPGEPISMGATERDRIARFKASFSTLETGSPETRDKILKGIRSEAGVIARNKSDSPSKIKAKLKLMSGPNNARWAYVTLPEGSANFLESQYVELAKNNLDHFGEEARHAYLAGHALAIQTAIAASKAQNTDEIARLFSLAEQYEMAAQHFLQDLGSSGHMRTPRRKLAELPNAGPKTAGLLSWCQHELDGKNGLVAFNDADPETPYFIMGDRCNYEPSTEKNRVYLDKACQIGLEQVYQAYTNPRQTLDINEPLRYTPHEPTKTNWRNFKARYKHYKHPDEAKKQAELKQAINDHECHKTDSGYDHQKGEEQIQSLKRMIVEHEHYRKVRGFYKEHQRFPLFRWNEQTEQLERRTKLRKHPKTENYEAIDHPLSLLIRLLFILPTSKKPGAEQLETLCTALSNLEKSLPITPDNEEAMEADIRAGVEHHDFSSPSRNT
ncbi:MAG: hypothetical protein COV52_00975 [Gammaproteobacteria bacterium CG11_big_fil_rev_8_21_14_0_20_46_22]|nr:MAG: hypothetical protein COW05_03265 [Gammaproteobacteria bacterium CG12_big_fil_rev_8_21_14_0_65_46_12]PIR11990.1 MAG: hypothetical protein COV52_00975 [Gammaproteobacteria bacterium CG11_big_fil_rev_8_21_14_0_20_46_22]